MIRSQSGPMAGVPLLAFPTSPLFRFDASAFRALLLRRLWRPLPLSSSACWCGRPLDAFGHHRSACAVSGVLGRRGFALESAAARVCREAGGRVTLNVRVSDLDLPPRGAQDQRRLEVVADGLPLFHGAQLAIDTTMVSAVRERRPTRSTVREGGWCSPCSREAPEGDHVPRALGSKRPRPFGGPCLRSGWPVVGGVHVVLDPARQGQGQARATCDSRQRPSCLVAQMELHPCLQRVQVLRLVLVGVVWWAWRRRSHTLEL